MKPKPMFTQEEEIEDPMLGVLRVALDYVYSLPRSSRSKNKVWRYFKAYLKHTNNWKDLNRGRDKPE